MKIDSHANELRFKVHGVSVYDDDFGYDAQIDISGDFASSWTKVGVSAGGRRCAKCCHDPNAGDHQVSGG